MTITWQELEVSDKELILEYDEKYDKTSNEELKELCMNGDATALYELASRFYLGCDGVEEDEKRALELYQRVLQKQRHVGAINRIGLLYEKGIAGEENASDCVKYYEIGSRWGGGGATEQLGLLYSQGLFVEKNLDKAIELFQLSVNQGQKHAYFNLGVAYKEKEVYPKAKICFEKAVELAKVYYSYICLGKFYEEGEGVEKNEEKAFRMYQLAYEHDIKEDGAYYMGKMYFYGNGVSEDNEKAYQLFQEALSGGIEESNYFLGLLNYLDDNPVVEKNAEKALEYLDKVPEHMQGMASERKGYICEAENRIEDAKKWYERAASLGNRKAVERLELLNESKEKKQARFLNSLLGANIEQLLAYYEQGVVQTIFLLADAYHFGKKGAKIDYTKAFRYYQEVIDKEAPGIENAYTGIASMYLNGRGVPRNISLAISYLEKAAKNQFGPACGMLGEIYRRGNGIPVDIDKAVDWYRQGAEVGDSVCDNCIAELYFQGKIGDRQNLEQGLEHIRKVLARDEKNPTACWYMANFTYHGVTENGKLLVSKDIPKAVEYFKIAAEGGWAEAYGELGGIFSEPDSELFDYDYALECYEKAIEKGDIWSAAKLAGLHLLPEFQKQSSVNPRKGVEAAKLFLENGDGSKGLKEMLMGMVMSYYDFCGVKSQYSQEGYLYLFNLLGSMGLAYTTEENMKRLSEIISLLYSKLASVYLDDQLHGLEKVSQMLEKLENISGRNQYIKSACKELLQTDYVKIGEIYLSEANLQEAKNYFEKAAWCGSDEAEKYLRRFSTSIFGKLIYR